MQQKFVKIMLLCFNFMLLIGCAGMFCSCQSDLTQTYKSHIADIRTTFFEGKTENFSITLTTGQRESPYVLDGVANALVDFGILTIFPSNQTDNSAFKYCIEIDGTEIEGDFEKSPFDSCYAADIQTQVLVDAEIFVYIKDGTKVEISKLECTSSKFSIDANKAVVVAIESERESLKQFLKDTNYELYVKVVADTANNITEKFWYVMFLREDGKEYAFIIDPNSSAILTKNCNIFLD